MVMFVASDAELIEGSLRDPGRFAEIFDRHGGEILRAVLTMRVVPGGRYWRHEFVIHPSAMPAGSAIYLSNVKITGSGNPGAAAFTIWVLRQDRLPPCTG
jgi:hypothetical protein